MEFVFEKNSPLPPHTQIKEQIKVALLLGNLRPGEILPSIRDLEKELGISRSTVRKAYLELEELGVLKLIQGKGVMVNKNLRYKEDRDFLQNCEKLAQSTRRSCQMKGLIFSSFARYLYQKAIEMEKEQATLLYVDVSSELAKERAAQVSRMLQVNVKGESVEELKASKSKLRLGTKVVCNYYRLDEISRILRGNKLDIIPLRMLIGEETKRELNSLPRRSKVMFIFDQGDQSGLSLILEDYRRAFADHELEFVSRSGKDITRLAKSRGVAKIIISNRIWNSIPKETREAEKVTQHIMKFDPSSIEESKMQLGIIA